jgi:hypothetical protein
LAHLTVQKFKIREEAPGRLEAVNGDLIRIQANAVRTTEDARFTEKQILSFYNDIQEAQQMIVKARVILARVKLALVVEKDKLLALGVMSTQLQREAATKVNELEELQIQLAQEISLAEGALKEQAIVVAERNQKLQLSSLETKLRSYAQRQL